MANVNPCDNCIFGHLCINPNGSHTVCCLIHTRLGKKLNNIKDMPVLKINFRDIISKKYQFTIDGAYKSIEIDEYPVLTMVVGSFGLNTLNELLSNDKDYIVNGYIYLSSNKGYVLRLITGRLRFIDLFYSNSKVEISINFNDNIIPHDSVRIKPAFVNYIITQLGEENLYVTAMKYVRFMKKDYNFYESLEPVPQKSKPKYQPNLCTIIQKGLYDIYDDEKDIKPYNRVIFPSDQINPKSLWTRINFWKDGKSCPYGINLTNISTEIINFMNKMDSDEYILSAFDISPRELNIVIITNKGKILNYSPMDRMDCIAFGSSTKSYVNEIPIELIKKFVSEFPIRKYNWTTCELFDRIVDEYNCNCLKKLKQKINLLKKEIDELENESNGLENEIVELENESNELENESNKLANESNELNETIEFN